MDAGRVLLALDETIDGEAARKHLFVGTPRVQTDTAGVSNYSGILDVYYDETRRLVRVSSPQRGPLMRLSLRPLSNEEQVELGKSGVPVVSDAVEFIYSSAADAMLGVLRREGKAPEGSDWKDVIAANMAIVLPPPPTTSCSSGGPGATSCSITSPTSGSCSVTCGSGYYACCRLSSLGPPQCTCVKNAGGIDE